MSAEDEKDVAGETAQSGAADQPPEQAPAGERSEKDAAAQTPAKPRAGRKRRLSKKPPAAEKASEEDAAAEQDSQAGPAPRGEPSAARERVAEQPAEPEKKPPPARPRRASRAPRRRVVRAHARYVRTSARKARMVCGHLRGKSVQEARAILAFTPREVARDWSKLLESAVANAEANHELLEDDLIVREAYADEGPTIKRFRPRAMGRATPIRKRTSHLTIALSTIAQPEKSKPTRK